MSRLPPQLPASPDQAQVLDPGGTWEITQGATTIRKLPTPKIQREPDRGLCENPNCAECNRTQQRAGEKIQQGIEPDLAWDEARAEVKEEMAKEKGAPENEPTPDAETAPSEPEIEPTPEDTPDPELEPKRAA